MARTGAERQERLPLEVPTAPRPRPAPPVATKPAPKRPGWLLHGAVFFVAFIFVSLFYVWTRTEVLKATYHLGRLQHRIESQTLYNQKLRLEKEALESPDRLAAVAVQRLGMLPPGEGRVVVVK